MTASAIPSLAWRGTVRSATFKPSFPRSQSTPSSSRFTGHTQPQNALPRTAAYKTSIGRAKSSQSNEKLFDAAVIWSTAYGSSRSRPSRWEDESVPYKGMSEGVGTGSSPPWTSPNRPHPLATTRAAKAISTPVCTILRAVSQRLRGDLPDASVLMVRLKPF